MSLTGAWLKPKGLEEGTSDDVELLNKPPPKPVDGVPKILEPKTELVCPNPLLACPKSDGVCPKDGED